LTSTVAATVHSVDPDVALAQLSTMEVVKDKLFIGDRFTMPLYGSFALLVLAAVGIYGVIAFAVSQRTHEIGLRIALGAGRSAMQSTLYGVQSTDFLVIASVGAILFATAVLASYLPVRRAPRIDAMQALRTE
jgi:putative ABC transport system permease protein